MKMRICKITAIRQTLYPELSEQYENRLELPCTVQVGQVFSVENAEKCPDGFCESAWETVRPFVKRLLNGEGNFYDGWMKNPYSAMLSCNDGFRPVSFYLELLEE